MKIHNELDVGTIRADDLTNRVLELFDEMPEECALRIRSDDEPRALYETLRAERADVFGWSVVSGSPADWCVDVIRLRPLADESELGRFFVRDHRALDVLFEQLGRDLRGAAPAGAPPLAELFARFAGGLDRHIRWEEELLFPAVEALEPGLADGPGRVMRIEHQRIRQLLAEARDHLTADQPRQEDRDAAAAALGEVQVVLEDHNHKEEAVYYPMANELIRPDAARQLLQQVRAMS